MSCLPLYFETQSVVSWKKELSTIAKILLFHDNMAEKIIDRLYSRFRRPEFLINAQIAISEANMIEMVSFADKGINFSHFMYLARANIILQIKHFSMTLFWNYQWISRWTHINLSPTIQTILEFSNWIEYIVDNIARVPVRNLNEVEKKNGTKKGQTWHTTSSDSKKEVNSILCDKDHFNTNCPEFLKKIIVKEKRLCSSCLKSGHGKDGYVRVHYFHLHNTLTLV